MNDWLSSYEDWILTSSTTPTIWLLIAVFAVLALVTLAGWRQWTPSLAAWFWFCVVNVAVWVYLKYAADIDDPDWRNHVRFVLVHVVAVSGIALIVTMARRFFFGAEDEPIIRTADGGPALILPCKEPK